MTKRVLHVCRKHRKRFGGLPIRIKPFQHLTSMNPLYTIITYFQSLNNEIIKKIVLIQLKRTEHDDNRTLLRNGLPLKQ